MVYRGQKYIGIKYSFYGIIKQVIPVRLLFPFLVACFVSVINRGALMWLPVVVFVIFNIKELKIIVNMIKTIVERPDVIDVKS